MAKDNPTIGSFNCPACELMGRTNNLVAIQLEKEGAGMAYFICDGRVDPGGMGCSYRGKFGRSDTETLKRQGRENEKKVNQKKDKVDVGTKAGNDAKPETTAGVDVAGSDDGFLS